MKRISILVLVLSFALVGCKGMVPDDQAVDYEEVKDLIEEAKPSNNVRGSCNVIAESSTCLDYIGSIWTEEQMKLNCQGSGTFSKNTCPYTEVGGCRTAGDTVAETVIWSYNYGGQPITPENEQYLAGACNALAPGQWVTPDQVFLNN